MKRQVTSAMYFRTLYMIYGAQAGTLVIFGIVVLYIKSEGTFEKEQTQLLQYVLIATLAIGLAASQIFPKIVLRKIDPILPLQNKMPKYYPVSIIRSACLELPGIFGCVVAFITGELYILILIPLLLILYYLYRPTITGVATELNLSPTERSQLEDPNAIIAEMEEASSD